MQQQSADSRSRCNSQPFHPCLIGHLIACLLVRLIDWPTDWLIDWLLGWLIAWLLVMVDFLTGWPCSSGHGTTFALEAMTPDTRHWSRGDPTNLRDPPLPSEPLHHFRFTARESVVWPFKTQNHELHNFERTQTHYYSEPRYQKWRVLPYFTSFMAIPVLRKVPSLNINSESNLHHEYEAECHVQLPANIRPIE